MRSVLLRRFLIVLVAFMLLAAIFIMTSYLLVGRDVYIEMELRDLLPQVEAVRQMLYEYESGNITRDAFIRMSKSLMKATNGMTFVVNWRGEIEFMYDVGLGLTSDEIRECFAGEIGVVLRGKRAQSDSAKIPNHGHVLFLGLPIGSPQEQSAGGVFIIKSIDDVGGMIERLNASLVWLAAAGITVLLLIGSWRASRIAGPLRSMAETALDMANGDFDVRVPNEEAPGEVGLLARSLNELCERLSKTIYQLRSEKSQLNHILHSLSDGVVAMDGLGALTQYNPAVMRMFGSVEVNTREDLVADASLWKVFDQVYATGKNQMITYDMPGDRTIWITISAVLTEDSECTGVVGLFKDMTEMERLEKMRREYVANVSHELRTPLTAVRGLLEPLADGMVKDEEVRQRYYKTMLHEVLRLSRLISDMMTLSRLQSGTEYMEVSKVDVAELLHDVAQSYVQTAKSKGIELRVDTQETVEALTDSDRVEQILIILIDNAMRYTPNGGDITLKLRNGNRLTVSVEDTGCGIPQEDVPHLFERFYKVDKSRKEGGTGLGLSIAYQIIEKLGEKITVTSELDKGTCFAFTLKKYVSNAIALGPAHETSPININIEGYEPQQKAAANQKDKRKPRDAEYEVLYDENISKKSGRPKNGGAV